MRKVTEFCARTDKHTKLVLDLTNDFEPSGHFVNEEPTELVLPEIADEDGPELEIAGIEVRCPA